MEWKNPHKHTVPQHQLQKEKKILHFQKEKKQRKRNMKKYCIKILYCTQILFHMLKKGKKKAP